jgi:UDP-3-O-[3-hydroxymyristoyl] glucosamine N-acyltransferase
VPTGHDYFVAFSCKLAGIATKIRSDTQVDTQTTIGSNVYIGSFVQIANPAIFSLTG